jgi:hypothetical protein
MGGGSSPGRPAQPPPIPQKTDAEIQAERAKSLAAARARKGRASTILAGEQTFLQPADTAQDKSLTLGGA